MVELTVVSMCCVCVSYLCLFGSLCAYECVPVAVLPPHCPCAHPSSGDWVSTDALDDLEASDVLRITAKPREVNVAIPPTGKKVTLLVSTSEQPQTVIRRLATRYFAKDLTVAKSLVLVNAVRSRSGTYTHTHINSPYTLIHLHTLTYTQTLGTPLVEGKTLREQGFDPSHDLAAVAKEETAAPKALRVPSTASDDPTLVLNAPEAGDVQAKGADLQVRTQHFQ